MPERRTIRTDYLARVEGEGAMTVRLARREVEHVELRIFEPPRFFEALLRGRSFREAPDITARICGICPVAYQMSAVQAMEDVCGVEIPEPIRLLRRLLYCGEWIESHALHVYMLHAPDFLGYDGAVELARDAPDVVERGLALKKTGNEVMALVGGREIHPVNVRVGGFYRAPTRRELRSLVEPLERAREAALETVRWTAGFDFPERAVECELVALSDARRLRDRARPDRVRSRPRHRRRPSTTRTSSRSTSSGRTRCTRGGRERGDLPVRPAGSLRARGRPAVAARAGGRARGRARGPVPRRRSAASSCAASSSCTRATRRCGSSTSTRSPTQPFVEVEPRGGSRPRRDRGAARPPLPPLRASTRDGTILDAKIVPPTSQNQLAIEDDLRGVVGPLRRPVRRRAARSLRADDPQLRPVHLLRDALPRPRGRAPVSGRVVDRRRQRVPRRRRGWVSRSPSCVRGRVPAGRRVLECEQEPTRLLDAWEGADVAVVVDAVRVRAPTRDRSHRVRREQRPACPPACSARRRTPSASATPSSSRARSAGCRSASSSTASRAPPSRRRAGLSAPVAGARSRQVAAAIVRELETEQRDARASADARRRAHASRRSPSAEGATSRDPRRASGSERCRTSRPSTSASTSRTPPAGRLPRAPRSTRRSTTTSPPRTRATWCSRRSSSSSWTGGGRA